MFAGTLSSCSLKTRDDAARGTGRDSAALSHEVQHVQRERERAVSHRLESWRREEIECVEMTPEDMRDGSFLLK